MIRAETKVRKHPKAADNTLGEGQGGVILHLDTGQYHGLNATGWAIWSLIDGAKTVGEVVAELGQKVADPPPDLRTDVVEFLEGLRERNLITTEESADHRPS